VFTISDSFFVGRMMMMTSEKEVKTHLGKRQQQASKQMARKIN